MGAGGRVLQLATDTMPVGELDGINDVAGVLYDYPPDWGTEFSGGIFALGRTPGCWRCGDPRHLRRDCPFPASQAERDGLPMNHVEAAGYPSGHGRPEGHGCRAYGCCTDGSASHHRSSGRHQRSTRPPRGFC